MTRTPFWRASRGVRAGRTSPSIQTVPESGAWAPAMTFVSVDLPEPFSPTSAWIVPRRTWKETSSRARTVPKVLVTPSTRTARSSRSGPSASGRSVVIVVGILRGHVDPGLVAVDDLVLDGHLGVALDPEVDPLLDGLAVEEHLGDDVLGVGGVAGVPELDDVDRAGLQQGGRVLRGRGPAHGDRVLETGLLDRLAHPHHISGGGALPALEVWIGAQQLLHALIGLLGIVRGLDAVPDQGHVRVVLLLVLPRRVDPFHVGG